MSKFMIREVPSGIKFDLKAANGQVIATSEVYAAKSVCLKGVESVRKNAPIAKLEDQTEESFRSVTNPKFELYRDKAGQFRFRLKARNGEIIATSEGYTSKAACENGIDSVRKNAAEAKIVDGASNHRNYTGSGKPLPDPVFPQPVLSVPMFCGIL